MDTRLILASASPRRKELLQQIGAAFEVLPARGEEVITGSSPARVVLELSRQKAAETKKRYQAELPERKAARTVILGSDTVVAFEGHILGKPKDAEAARKMLGILAGHTHSVFTGVTWIVCEKDVCETHSFFEETEVSMYPMTPQEIAAYVATKEPMDKAGAYAIQGKGAVYIKKILGDYNTVVGFPVARIYQELKRLGIEIL